MEKFDVIVIGSGPGGYVAAIRCAQLGLKTAIVEKYNTLGGTCLNVGCIPSKALLDSSEHFHQANTKFNEHGIKTGPISLDFNQMMQRKNKVVSETCKGVDYLMEKNKISIFKGLASFISINEINIKPQKGKNIKLKPDKVILATGSKPSSLPFAKIDKKRIITSTEALSFKTLPKSIAIIGGGVIGLELGSVYQRLGVNVSVIEYEDMVLPGMDKDIRKEAQRVLKKQGIKINVKHE